MAFDAHANLAICRVAVPPSPSTSGTSLTVAAGKGALFPAAPFNLTMWLASATVVDSTVAEVVRVTAVAGDVLTLVRGQEGTSALAVAANDWVAATITAKSLRDVEVAASAFIFRDETGGTWPLRSTLTSDPQVRVTWVGSVAPAIGGGYMQAQDVASLVPGDVWEQLS